LPLDAVATSGSRLGLTNRELPASVSVVTQEMMLLRGLRTAVEAVEAVVGMTGGTQFGSIPNYSTRGFGGNNVSVLRDGIRQNTASQSSRTVDSFILERIEVLKGPDGLMYGEGTIGGAVNYLSKSPSDFFQGNALASLGPWGSYRLGVGLGGPLIPSHSPGALATVAYRADFSHNETGGYQDRNHQRYDAAALSLAWRATDRFTLTWWGTYLEDRNESYYGNPVIYDAVVNTTIPNAQPEVRTFNSATDRMINPRVDPASRRTNYNILDNYAATENSFNRVRADWRLSPEIELRNESYVTTQLLKWRNIESNTWNPSARNITRGNLTLIYRDDLLVGDRLDLTVKRPLAGRTNRLVVGAQFERNNQIRGGAPGNVGLTNPAVSLLDPNVGYGAAADFKKTSRIVVETHAFHIQDVLDVTSRFKAVAGLRYDHIQIQRDTLFNPTTTPVTSFSTFKKGYRAYTGRIGGVWSLSKDVNAYASFSRAAEPVTQLVSLTTTQADYSLQKGRQYELGVKGTFFEGKLDATLALFDLVKKDILTSTLDPDTGLRISQQIGAQKSRGVEMAVAVSPSEGWRIEMNAAFTDSYFADFNENLGSGVISRAGKRPSNVPEWVTNLFVSKRVGGWTISGGPRYVSDRFANNNNSVVAEGYVTLDASLAYAWKRWSFALRGRNLLDEEYEPVAGTTMRRLADPISAEFSTRVAF
ncbi:MAG TPA: TonB-dependent receptor, partial [Opitutaceae bacterium]|nr:TonB-dependent receptor [Opitutaceae bacterium]